MKVRIIRLTAAAACAILVLSACNLPTVANQPVDNASNTNSQSDDVSNDSGISPDIPDFPGRQACEELSEIVADTFPLTIFISQESFETAESGLGGTGCRIFTSGNGLEITDWAEGGNSLLAAFNSQGWNSDPAFSGGGAGGLLTTYRREGIVCQLVTEVGPADEGYCGEEALAACLARLAPEQVLYTVTIECSPDGSTEEDTADDPQPMEREEIIFDVGGISAYRHGSLPASDMYRYVLQAEAGQQLVVSLRTTPPLSGLITIFGEDGNVLLSDHGDSMFWYGNLTVSQNYFITVRSYPEWPVDFTLSVILPPAGESHIESHSPMAAGDCDLLANQIGQTLGVSAYITPGLFEDHINQTAGIGCQITAWGDGVQFPDWPGTTGELLSTLETEGWVEDPMYAAGGAGGMAAAFRKDGNLCIYVQQIREVSRELCPSNQPVSACWAGLEPEQLTYTVTMNCVAPQ